MSVEMTPQTKIDYLEFLLLVGRLPAGAHEHFVGMTAEPREMSAMCCLMFAGMGIVWPLPCLSRQYDGSWFRVQDCSDGKGGVRQQ